MESTQVFHPTTIPRTGERNAWILTAVAVVAYLLLWRLSEANAVLLVMVIFLLLSASLISLGNWIDRKTALILSPGGVEFSNRLRNVHLDWQQIEDVRVTSDRWGSRVQVAGADASFNFRMLSEVEFRGQVRGQMGFQDGETILKRILQASGLSLMNSNDQVHYYARP